MAGIENTLDTVAQSLRAASERTHDLSEEASEALSIAAAEVLGAAEKLRMRAANVAGEVARQTAHEVKQHPIASLAAALTAIAALAGMIAASRSHNRNDGESSGKST